MSSKHFSNDPLALVYAGLRALTLTNPSVEFDETQKTVYRKGAVASSNVAVISGGGSGHEPSFAGFVGNGFLSSAVAGSIFASPSTEQVYRCLLRLGLQRRDRGILVLIMNYTGDKLHFGMAVEKARSAGIKCELLVVGDEVRVGRPRPGRIVRQGLAGTVLVQKIAGALAVQGRDLSEVYNIARLVADNVVTIGASLAHVHIPGRAASKDELAQSLQIEIGMGIHNEEGYCRINATLSGLVSTLLLLVLGKAGKDRDFIDIPKGHDVVLMINNLGGISQLELGAITAEVCSQLADTYGLTPKRVLSGTYMSSLNGQGFSITLLKLVDPSWLSLIDAPTEASGWLPAINPSDPGVQDTADNAQDGSGGADVFRPSNLRVNADVARKALRML